MAYIFNLDNTWVSSALVPKSKMFEESTIVVTDKAVNIFLESDIALGLNTGSKRMAFKHNNILFKTNRVKQDNWHTTYVSRPSIQRGFVMWSGDFSPANTFDAISGISLEIEDSVTYSASFSGDSISFTEPEVFRIYTDGGVIKVDDADYSGNTITIGDFKATLDEDKLNQIFGQDYSFLSELELQSPEEAFDLSYEKIDIPNGTYDEIEIILDKENLAVDEFGQVYFKVPDFDFNISKNAIWFEGSRREYLKSDQFSFILDGGDDVYYEFSKDRLRAAINEEAYFVDGLINCSERTYIGYAKVYSSYVYVDFYFMQREGDSEECAALEDTTEAKRACRLKVKKDSIEMSKIDDDIEFIEINSTIKNDPLPLYDKIRFGIGCFMSDYKMYTYRDDRDTLEVIFNRESSSKYIKLEMEDQSTRYYADITVKDGTQESTKTKKFQRYSSTAMWSLGSTAYINTILKRSFDSVSDTNTTKFTNAAISLETDTVKIFTRTLYINVLNQTFDFPQQSMSYETLAVLGYVDGDELLSLQVDYIPSSGVIYGRIERDSEYETFDKPELLDMMNSLNPEYSFSLTCNLSLLKYTDLNGVAHDMPFSNSTLIIAERTSLNGETFYRVYYKNIDSYGFINALTFKVEE